MAIKILSLDGLNDAKLCDLTTQLIRTIPGVNSANIEFLSQKLTMDISGRDENETIDEVVATLKDTIPGISVARTDVGRAAPPPPGERPDGPTVRRVEPPKKKKRRKHPLSLRADAVIYLFGWIISAVLWGFSLWRPSLALPFCAASLFLSVLFSLFFKWSRPRKKYILATILTSVLAVAAFALLSPRQGAGVMLCYLGSMVIVSILCDVMDSTIRSTLDIRPATVVRLRENELARVSPDEVEPGDRVLLSTGDLIPFNGIAAEGSAQVDMSLFTGEETPVTVRAGGPVLCGEKIVRGPLTIEVSSPQEQSAAYRLYTALTEDPSLTETEDLLNKWSVITLLAAFAAAIILGFLRFSPSLSSWLSPVLGAAILAVPCGNGAMAGFAVRACASRMLRAGILPGSPSLFDIAARIHTVATGYTGVLTQAQFHITNIVPAAGMPEEEVFRCAAAAEYGVPHPIASAIADEYEQEQGKPIRELFDSPGESVSGYGARSVLEQRSIMVGSRRMMDDSEVEVPPNTTGQPSVYVLSRGNYIGVIETEDTWQPDAQQLVPNLHAAGIERTALVTGCDAEVGQAAQVFLGVDEVFSERSATKKETLDQLCLHEGNVENLLYVGTMDELNLMNTRCLGIVMGTDPMGPPLSVAAAVIPSGSLRSLMDFIRLTRSMRTLLLCGLGVVLALKAAVLAAIIIWGISPLFSALVNAVGAVFLPVSLCVFLKESKKRTE